MTTIEEKQYIINKIQDILNKIKINHLANQKELEELQREYNDIIKRNNLSEFESQENKALETFGLPKSQERIDSEIISKLNKFYESKLLLYTYLIDLLHLNIKNYNSLEREYLKYKDLTSKIKKLSKEDRSDLFSEILFNLVIYEIAFNKTRKILDSISEKEIFDICEYLKKNINKEDNPRLYKKLTEDIIDREELYEILSSISTETLEKERIRLKEYEEKQKKLRELKLKELKKRKKSLEKSLSSWINNPNGEVKSIMDELKLCERVLEQKESYYEERQKEKPSLSFKPFISILVSGALMFTAGRGLRNLNFRPEKKYSVMSEISNNLDYNSQIIEDGYLKENYIEEHNIKSSTKMTIYSVWKPNTKVFGVNSMYVREVIEYEIDDIDLENINDYFSLDRSLFRCTNKYMESKSTLSENDLYTQEYAEIEKTKLDLDNYIEIEPSETIKTLIIIILLTLVDIISAVPKYIKTGEIEEDESYELITGIILLIREIIECVNYNQILRYYHEEIKQYQRRIEDLEKEKEELINRKENATYKSKIDELNSKIKETEKLINMIEHDEYYTVSNEHVTSSGNKLVLEK